VINAPKSGKAQALNIGLALAKMPLFASVDADTRLAPEALGIVTEKFNGGPDIISVAGIVIPTRHDAGQDGAARRSWLIPYQSLEYAIDFAYRLGWETVNGAHIMSGAFTLFKTGLLRDVGGFNSRTLTEDYEIIHRLRAHCSDHGIAHRILTAPSAMAYTNAPVRLGVFLRQRTRWFQGFLQTQLAYRHLIGRFRYGWFGALTMPLKSIDAISPLIVFVALLSFAFSKNDTTICIASLFLISGGIRLLIDWATGAVTMLRRHGRVAPYESPADLARMILLMPVYFVINRVLWLVIGTTAYGRLLTGSRRW
jgi:cellulose synthase/poly-beta-1,6-N-acetylglucosamine synthase-like glycosyltransferase